MDDNEEARPEQPPVESQSAEQPPVQTQSAEKPPVRFSRRWLLVIGAVAAGAVLGLARLAGLDGENPSASSSAGGRVPDFSGRFPVLYVESSVPAVPPEKWTVEVGGLVEQEVTIDHEQWKALPHVAYTKDFHCVEGWSVDDVDWTGVRVSEVLSLAKPRPEGKFVNFLAYGGKYTDDLAMAQALHRDTLLADGFEGVPLTPEHGGPVRLVIPTQLGYKNVKWVVRLEVTAERNPGYWEQRGYPVEAPIAMAQGMQRRL